MTKSLYEAPSIVEIGTLHELTLLTKNFTGGDFLGLRASAQNTSW